MFTLLDAYRYCGLLFLQVGRVRTEERILSNVDHPFLATLYGTLQTGGGVRLRALAPDGMDTWLVCMHTVLTTGRTYFSRVALTLCVRCAVQTPTCTSFWSTAMAASCMPCSIRSQSELRAVVPSLTVHGPRAPLNTVPSLTSQTHFHPAFVFVVQQAATGERGAFLC